MAINKEWHLKHRMPANPTIEQRIKWHIEHQKHCSCRKDIPAGIKKLLKEKGVSISK